MIRGETTFICTQCKNKFTAMDIEYHCMALSCPMPCPHCGSIRTLPLHKLQEWTSPLEKNIGEIIETNDEKNVRFYPFTKGYGEKWKEKKVKNDNNSTADFCHTAINA